jgi:Ala-tRNA(Pro) deacylase
MKVQEFLNQHHANYDVVMHPAAYDAQRMAQSVHVKGERVAKTVLLKADKGFKFVMAVLPATHHVDLVRVKQVIGAGDLELASEDEVAAHCPDCEVGAMPPFGSQLDVETLVDECLAREEEIVFQGNTHMEAIRMKYRDYYELEHPLVAKISRHE